MKNQILVTKSESNKNHFKPQTDCDKMQPNETVNHCPSLFQFSKKKDWFKFQFSFSVCILIVSILGGCFYFYQLGKREDFSDNLLANYNIYRLYSSRKHYYIC